MAVHLYYTVSDISFSVSAALVDKDNPLDSVSGTFTRYYLNDRDWKEKDDESFKETLVTNGSIYETVQPLCL